MRGPENPAGGCSTRTPNLGVKRVEGDQHRLRAGRGPPHEALTLRGGAGLRKMPLTLTLMPCLETAEAEVELQDT
jgi:hypothetical protein